MIDRYANIREEKAATPHNELIVQLLDSRVPKSEREHAAAREIERLREEVDALKAENEMLRESLKDADNELDWLDKDMDKCDHSVGVCMCSYWYMRRKMKATLAKLEGGHS